MLKMIVVLLMSVCFAGCSSMQAIQSTRPEAIQSDVHVGDTVSVTTKKGLSYEFAVTALTKDTLMGTGNNMVYKVLYENIQSLEVKKISTGETAAALTGTIVVIGAVFLVAVAYVLSHIKPGN